VTGSSDDDPSGIATYSQTGAQFGYSQRNNQRVMGEHVNSRAVGLLGWTITIIVGCCALISGQVT
jgi:Mn2+/Fe2+ NRAMP family transporter